MKRIEVVAAIIKHNDSFLCVQRGESKLDYISKKFEFPGGKIEDGETEYDSIKREIDEELHMRIEPVEKIMTVEHTYPDFHITMHGILCTCEDSNFTLTEHIDSKWLKKEELMNLDWAAADIPIVEKLTAL